MHFSAKAYNCDEEFQH